MVNNNRTVNECLIASHYPCEAFLSLVVLKYSVPLLDCWYIILVAIMTTVRAWLGGMLW